MPAYSHKEVIGFDISVYEALAVNVFYTANHLVRQHKNRFNCEPSGAEIEKVFQGRTQKVHNQHVVFAFLAIPSETKGESISHLKSTKSQQHFLLPIKYSYSPRLGLKP